MLEPGFWGMFEKRRNLDGEGDDFVIYCAVSHGAAAWKFDSNYWKKKVQLRSLSTLSLL